MLGGLRDDGGYEKMTELSDIIDIWSYRSFRILIYVEEEGYTGNLRRIMATKISTDGEIYLVNNHILGYLIEN